MLVIMPFTQRGWTGRVTLLLTLDTRPPLCHAACLTTFASTAPAPPTCSFCLRYILWYTAHARGDTRSLQHLPHLPASPRPYHATAHYCSSLFTCSSSYRTSSVRCLHFCCRLLPCCPTPARAQRFPDGIWTVNWTFSVGRSMVQTLYRLAFFLYQY